MFRALALSIALALSALQPKTVCAASSIVPYSQQLALPLNHNALRLSRRRLGEPTGSVDASSSPSPGAGDAAAPRSAAARADFAAAQKDASGVAAVSKAAPPQSPTPSALRVRDAFFLVLAVVLGVACLAVVVSGRSHISKAIERLRGSWNEAEMIPLGRFVGQRPDTDNSTRVALLREYGGVDEQHLPGSAPTAVAGSTLGQQVPASEAASV